MVLAAINLETESDTEITGNVVNLLSRLGKWEETEMQERITNIFVAETKEFNMLKPHLSNLIRLSKQARKQHDTSQDKTRHEPGHDRTRAITQHDTSHDAMRHKQGHDVTQARTRRDTSKDVTSART